MDDFGLEDMRNSIALLCTCVVFALITSLVQLVNIMSLRL